MDGTLTVLISLATGLAALIGSVFVARRYQQLGGGEAQKKLNAVYRELNGAFEEQINELKGQIASRDKRIKQLETDITAARAERRTLKQDVDDLHEQIRALRAQVNGKA